MRKEVVWSVSNLTAGSSEQIQMIIDCGLFDQLIHLMMHDDPTIKKEAIWAIANATSNCSDQVI